MCDSYLDVRCHGILLTIQLLDQGCDVDGKVLNRLDTFLRSNITQLLFAQAEIVAQLVEQSGADLLPDFIVRRADGFNVLPINDDSVGERHLEGALLGQRDAVEKPQQQATPFLRVRRSILNEDGDVGEPGAEVFRQTVQGLLDELLEMPAIHGRSARVFTRPAGSSQRCLRGICYNEELFMSRDLVGRGPAARV